MPIRRWLGKFDDGKFQTLGRMKDSGEFTQANFCSGEFYSGENKKKTICTGKFARAL